MICLVQPLLTQGHPRLVAQDHVLMAFRYLQAWQLQHLPGQPVPVLGHPHSEKVFPALRQGLMCFSSCSLFLCCAELGNTVTQIASVNVNISSPVSSLLPFPLFRDCSAVPLPFGG